MAGSYFARQFGEQIRTVSSLGVRSFRQIDVARGLLAKPVFRLRLSPIKPETLQGFAKLRTAFLPSWLMSFCNLVMSQQEQPASQAGKQVADEQAKISEQSDQNLPFQEMAECIVYDADGKEHRFGSFYDNNTAVVVFIRHFLCHVCKQYVEDMAMVDKEKLKTSKGDPIRLIIIGCGMPKFIGPFREATKYQGELYVDPDLVLYHKLNLTGAVSSLNPDSGKSPHAHTTVSAVVDSVKRTIQSRGESQGPISQQGGSFILGPSNVCKWAHRDGSAHDHAPINTLLEKVGIGPVDFAAERRARSLPE